MNNKNRQKQLFITTAFFTALAAHAAGVYKYKTDSNSGEVNFKAIGKPAFLKINGKGEGAKGALTVEGSQMSGEMIFNLNSLNTGIDMRDEHMKEKYLRVKEHPTSTFKFEKVSIQENSFKGKLTLNGISKDVDAKCDTKGIESGSKSDVTCELKVLLSDFNIEIPEYAGIKVANEVNIEVKSKLTQETTPTLAR